MKNYLVALLLLAGCRTNSRGSNDSGAMSQSEKKRRDRRGRRD